MINLRFLLIGLVILSLSCATIPTKPISQSDLSSLMGEWKGDRYCNTHLDSQIVNLKLNENLEGKLIGIKTYPFQGKIENGQLVILLETGLQMKLNFYKDSGKLMLKGNYRWDEKNCIGTFSFRKVE